MLSSQTGPYNFVSSNLIDSTPLLQFQPNTRISFFQDVRFRYEFFTISIANCITIAVYKDIPITYVSIGDAS